MNTRKELYEKGFVFIPRLKPHASTEEVASLIGSVFNMPDYFGYEKIPKIQQITPKKSIDSFENKYSGNFGLSSFPLHTDLAHWSIPPKFLVLRCIKGAVGVSTKILTVNSIIEDLKILGLKRAVFSPRKTHKYDPPCLLPSFFDHDGNDSIRWDSLFLRPENSSAKKIASAFDADLFNKRIIGFKLIDKGDTLVINNYTNLHGRSEVPRSSLDRVIERVYLDEIYL